MAALLSLDQDGARLLPLVSHECSQPEAAARIAAHSPRTLFPSAYSPEAAAAGLLVYFSCWEEAHRKAQDIPSAEGSYWHGVLHRQEPDAANSKYWFHRVGSHEIFPDLARTSAEILAKYPGNTFQLDPAWNPFTFVDFCEAARLDRGSANELSARAIQLAEWQLLFDYCARPLA